MKPIFAHSETINFRTGALSIVVLLVSACGGGGGGGGGVEPSSGGQGTVSYTVGGSVSGLTGTLGLLDSGADPLTIISNGQFTFPEQFAADTAFDIKIQTQPVGETCVIANGTGSITDASISNVTVTCQKDVPTEQLQAFAATYVTLQAVSAIADVAAALSTATPCASGGAAIFNTSTKIGTFINCTTAFEPGNTYSGELATNSATDPLAGFVNATSASLTISNAAPIGTTFTLTSGGFTSNESVADGTLTGQLGTIGASNIDFTAGTSSHYQISTASLSSPTPFTRTLVNSVSETSIPEFGATVTLNNAVVYVCLTNGTPIVWQGTGNPSAGSFDIVSTTPSSLHLTVTFQNSTIFTVTDDMTGDVYTKHWTDADVRSVLQLVVQ